MKKSTIAIVGATGAVGQMLLQVLTERHFPLQNLYPLASEKSVGKSVLCQGKNYVVENLANFDFAKADISFFAAGGSVSAEYAPRAAAKGSVVIDKSSHFRLDSDVPLIVPEVNPAAIVDYKKRNIIATPNCSTIQMVVALKPIYDVVGITRINVATYQAVSGTGVKGVTELQQQTEAFAKHHKLKTDVYLKPIAFNVIPHCDSFQENDYTKEEMKLVWETQKIFNDSDIKINATAVRVPVFYGHSEAIHLETREKITKPQALKLLAQAEGITLFPDNTDYPTAIEVAGTNSVYVGRVREDISHERGLDLWVVADNIRKGAAYNAVQIAELLINSSYN